MWSRNAISDFFFCKKYFCEFVLVIMLNHFVVYVSIVRFEFFRDDERSLIRFFEVTKAWRSDSSDSTKTIHQIWRKRFIKFDESDSSNLIRAIFHQIELNDFLSNSTNNISSNVMSCISSNLMSDISSNLMSDSSLNLMSDISSNLMSDISSNFEKEKQFFYFLISDFMHRHIIWRT
jgi:hypothetical protein